MFWLKMCPRCKGDLYLAEDRFGQHLACLQCGRSLSSKQQMAQGVLGTRDSISRKEHVA